MVGRAGASQDAPVSVRPVMPTPSGSTTREIGISGGGNIYFSLEVAPYGYNPQPDSPVTCYSLQRRHGFHRPCQSLRNLRRNPD
ncbi:ash family protein [Citrobacter braakii]